MTMPKPLPRRPGSPRPGLRRLACGGLAAALAACAAPQPAPEASAGDLCRRIAELHVAAQRSAFALDMPESERRLRAILSLHEDRGDAPPCRGVIDRPVALAELGVALSGQRKFNLAEASFAEAEAAIAALRADPGEVSPERIATSAAQVALLEAKHDLNRRQFSRAADRSGEGLRLLGSLAETRAYDFGELIELAPDERERILAGISGNFTQSASLSRSGDVDAARAAIATAMTLADAIPGSTAAMRSRIMSEQALVEVEADRPEAALPLASAAADQLATEMPGTALAGRARLIEASVLARLGRDAEAYAAFETAFAAYEETPAALQYESIWPFIKLSIERRAAGELDDAAMAAGVFRAAQLVRTASAAGDIAQTAALLETGSGEAAAAVRAWRAAQEELRLLTTAIQRRDLQPFEREALNRRLSEAADREAGLRARRDRIAPEYRRAIESPATLAEVQAALRPGEALLQILVGDPRSTLIWVQRDRVRVTTSRANAEVARVIAEVIKGGMIPDRAGRLSGFNAGFAHSAYNIFLGSLGTEIEATERLFVTATGPLQGLPFELLVVEDPTPQAAALDQGDYSGLAWLADRTTFSYLPAPRALSDLRASAGSAAARSAIGFGDYAPGDDSTANIDPRRRESCGQEVSVIRGLIPLPGTRTELDLIEAALGGTMQILSGDAFTEEAVKALSDAGTLREFRVVHMATHGMLWPTIDCFEPALTARPLPGGSEDGLLESSEIRALSLDAQLVVLSACQSTDVEDTEAGESLSGLARAFFTAGARSVIATHWAVEDRRTAELMGDFYRRIAADPTLAFADALAAATAALRADPASSHPAFWAPFVLLGDGALSLDPA